MRPTKFPCGSTTGAPLVPGAAGRSSVHCPSGSSIKRPLESTGVPPPDDRTESTGNVCSPACGRRPIQVGHSSPYATGRRVNVVVITRSSRLRCQRIRECALVRDFVPISPLAYATRQWTLSAESVWSWTIRLTPSRQCLAVATYATSPRTPITMPRQSTACPFEKNRTLATVSCKSRAAKRRRLCLSGPSASDHPPDHGQRDGHGPRDVPLPINSGAPVRPDPLCQTTTRRAKR